jgi:hypothetical protein
MPLFSCRLLILLALTSVYAIGQTGIYSYYISPAGSDINPGSQALPWRTLQHAADSMELGSAGTIIHVAAGTYGDMRYCQVTGLVSGASLACIQRSGTATRPIIFQSEERWKAKLRCSDSTGMFMLVGSYIQVIGFDMSCPYSGSFAGATYGNNSHNTFVNNYLQGFDVKSCTSLGVLNGNVSPQRGWTNIGHHVASGNVIHHAGAAGGAPNNCNQEHGLYFSDPYDVLTNNIISGVVGAGIHSYGGGVCHQVISNNTIFDNSQGGIVIENVATASGYWDECGNGGISDYNTITNNIIVNNGIGETYTGEYGGIDGRGRAGGGHNLFSNNLICGNQPRQTALVRPDVSVNQITALNIMSVFASYKSDHNWAPVADYNIRYYSLGQHSPAIDTGTHECAAGSTSCAPSVDIIGTPRPQGRERDIGAFELIPE